MPAVMLPPCEVESPCRAAGLPPINTEVDPLMMESGGPAHVHFVPTVAAGFPQIKTEITPAGIIGPPVCGLAFGFVIGQV